MNYNLLHIKDTTYGGRGLFATTSVLKNALVHACSSPYASVIYRVFRKEVCGHCFSDAFDSNRNAWNIRCDGAGEITSKKDLDAAWETSTLDLEPLTELELDTVRFLASAIIERYAGGGEWADFIQLQDNELKYILARPRVFDSQFRVYAFLRKAAQAAPVFHAYVTVDTVRAILARDQGNVFRLYDVHVGG
ncbi:hypothetical protein EV421DRAFT_1962152 [Armillaria borealis]|uniref:Uncharacterized protein n=1 Tax=Armillaria borealis TaxID=47425 RepID=A0AA39MNU7_9AGAR|nr:hypothetical protein EV421DRAFT_1962152 [Armillaria borealis]